MTSRPSLSRRTSSPPVISPRLSRRQSMQQKGIPSPTGQKPKDTNRPLSPPKLNIQPMVMPRSSLGNIISHDQANQKKQEEASNAYLNSNSFGSYGNGNNFGQPQLNRGISIDIAQNQQPVFGYNQDFNNYQSPQQPQLSRLPSYNNPEQNNNTYQNNYGNYQFTQQDKLGMRESIPAPQTQPKDAFYHTFPRQEPQPLAHGNSLAQHLRQDQPMSGFKNTVVQGPSDPPKFERRTSNRRQVQAQQQQQQYHPAPNNNTQIFINLPAQPQQYNNQNMSHLQPPHQQQHQESGGQSESANEGSQAGDDKKQRGRKLTEHYKYIAESKQKIKGWNADLKKKGVSKDDQHSLRNKISALESRIAKREELKGLQDKIAQRRARFEKLVDIVSNVSCQNCSGSLCKHVRDALPITSELSFQPVVNTSVSANTQIGGRLTNKKDQPSKATRTGKKSGPGDVKAELKDLLMSLYDSVSGQEKK